MTNQITSYEKAIEILTSQGKFYINLGLERVQKLLNLYSNPQEKIKCIHVAGTNGKGSTCVMLASVLTEAGYKTGLYTSPHLVDYTERIKINGKDISKEEFADLIFDIIKTAESNNIHATEFEILTVLAFIYFDKEKVDFVVLETGLGGRLDATNIIKNPLLSIITTIDFDHIDRLGDTIEKIAFEKAGIIKQNVPVITLKNNKGLVIIKEKAVISSSNLILAEETFFCHCERSEAIHQPAINEWIASSQAPRNDENYESNLKGLWQKKNLSLVMKAIEELKRQNIRIPDEAVKIGLKNVSWAARFQYIEEINLILDGAHNPNAAKLLVESLEHYYPDKKRIWIYSSINTKEYGEVMKILFRNGDTIILTQINSASAVFPETLKEKLTEYTCKIYITKNINESINKYLQLIESENDKKDVSKKHAYIGIMAGSLYSAGEFLKEYFF